MASSSVDHGGLKPMDPVPPAAVEGRHSRSASAEKVRKSWRAAHGGGGLRVGRGAVRVLFFFSSLGTIVA